MDSDASHTGCQWSLPANNKPYDAIKCQQCTLSIRQYRCSISWMRPIATNGVTWSVCLSRPWPLQKRLNQSWCSSGFDRRGPKEHVLDRSPDPHSLKECPETGRQKSQTPLIRFVAQQAVQQVHNKSTTNRKLYNKSMWRYCTTNQKPPASPQQIEEMEFSYDLLWICCSVAANHGRELTWHHIWRVVDVIYKNSYLR